MEQDVACSAASAKAILRTESVPFADIPGQSKLFLDYQRDPTALKKFYPTVVASHTEISDRIPDVLANYSTDRDELCDALTEINRSFNAGENTLANIALLRGQDCVAVLTGQQAGLFTGPLYTIYKALSVVKEAECLRARGFKGVPIFWIATEDHDFAEVDEAVVLDRVGAAFKVRSEAEHLEAVPVGTVRLTGAINGSIDSIFTSMRHTEFTTEVRSMVASAFAAGETFGNAFGKLLAALTSRFGLIVADPMHPTLKRLAAPMYVAAIERSEQIVDAILKRTKHLAAAGYAPQVAVTEDYFPLFWHSNDGQRLALRADGKGNVRAKNPDNKFTLGELASLAADAPARFSPNVMLRAAVQDFIFPTVCYFGGSAEIAYFAQNSEVYRCLDRPITPILHRQSFSVIEAKHQRTMQAYELGFTDLFQGFESLLPRIVDQFLDRKTAQTFAEVEESINTDLNRLDRELSSIDAGLAANLATRRRKILYHIAALNKKFRAVEVRKDETANRRITSMFNALLPDGALQERSLNVTYLLNNYGPNVIDWIYDAIDLDDRGHRLVYL